MGRKIAIKFGLVVGLLMTICFWVIRIYFSSNAKLTFILFLILIFGVLAALQQLDKQSKYTATFGDLFRTGFATLALSILLVIIQMWLTYSLNPQLKQQELLELKTGLITQKKYSEQDANVAVAEQASRFISAKTSQYMFPFLYIGLAFTALGSFAIGRKNKR